MITKYENSLRRRRISGEGALFLNTAVILAGGKSRRMGTDKLSLPQGDTTVLRAAVQRFSKKFDKVLLSVDAEGRYPDIDIEHVCDIYPGCGPLAGLHAALRKAGGDGVFLAAADLPFSDPDAARRMIELCGEHEICIVRDVNGRFEPLFGYYKAVLLPEAERILAAGGRAMTELITAADTLTLSVSELDAGGRMLFNMNRPEDYDELLGSG